MADEKIVDDVKESVSQEAKADDSVSIDSETYAQLKNEISQRRENEKKAREEAEAHKKQLDAMQKQLKELEEAKREKSENLDKVHMTKNEMTKQNAMLMEEMEKLRAEMEREKRERMEQEAESARLQKKKNFLDSCWDQFGQGNIKPRFKKYFLAEVEQGFQERDGEFVPQDPNGRGDLLNRSFQTGSANDWFEMYKKDPNNADMLSSGNGNNVLVDPAINTVPNTQKRNQVIAADMHFIREDDHAELVRVKEEFNEKGGKKFRDVIEMQNRSTFNNTINKKPAKEGDKTLGQRIREDKAAVWLKDEKEFMYL